MLYHFGYELSRKPNRTLEYRETLISEVQSSYKKYEGKLYHFGYEYRETLINKVQRINIESNWPDTREECSSRGCKKCTLSQLESRI